MNRFPLVWLGLYLAREIARVGRFWVWSFVWAGGCRVWSRVQLKVFVGVIISEVSLVNDVHKPEFYGLRFHDLVLCHCLCTAVLRCLFLSPAICFLWWYDFLPLLRLGIIHQAPIMQHPSILIISRCPN